MVFENRGSMPQVLPTARMVWAGCLRAPSGSHLSSNASSASNVLFFRSAQAGMIGEGPLLHLFEMLDNCR